MKKLFVIFLLMGFSLGVLIAQNNHVKVSPVGTWKFDAPYAPEEYNSGIIVVETHEKKLTGNMSFKGNDFKFPCENLKADDDSILFSVYIQGQDVKIMLKIENDTLISGKAIYTEGEVPLSLIKTTVSETETKQ
jgi:hypothetical protein